MTKFSEWLNRKDEGLFNRLANATHDYLGKRFHDQYYQLKKGYKNGSMGTKFLGMSFIVPADELVGKLLDAARRGSFTRQEIAEERAAWDIEAEVVEMEWRKRRRGGTGLFTRLGVCQTLAKIFGSRTASGTLDGTASAA